MRKKCLFFICLFLFTLLLNSCNPLKPQLSYTISGIIKDASGKGIDGVPIYFSNNFGNVTTSTDGAWSKSGLIGAVTVTPDKTGMTFNPVNVQVTKASNTINFIASEVCCTSPYTVSGKIIDSNGTPIEGVNLNFGEYGYSMTAIDGTWSKTNLQGIVTVTPENFNLDFTPARIELSGPINDVNFIASKKKVIFADANLEAAVRDAIDKPTGDLYPENVDNIIQLWCSNRKISSLNGIEYLSNLKILYAYGNNISDLTSLQYLVKLDNIDISENNITDISPLSELPNLLFLDLENNFISDITSLTKLTNLDLLFISGNQISDLTPILSMHSLYYLSIDNNPCGYLDSLLESIPQIKYLALSPDQLTDFTTLSILPNLTQLSINGNDTSKLTDISFVSNLTKLEDLFLRYNQISDLGPLSNLPFLQSLALEYCNSSNITQLATLTNLESLYLFSNSIVDISPLTGLINLKNLYLSGNQITDLSPLENLNNIYNLDLSHNQVTDILPLVNNQGINTGDYVDLDNNNLDTSDPNSDDMQNINTLLNRGVRVYYDDQFNVIKRNQLISMSCSN